MCCSNRISILLRTCYSWCIGVGISWTFLTDTSFVWVVMEWLTRNTRSLIFIGFSTWRTRSTVMLSILTSGTYWTLQTLKCSSSRNTLKCNLFDDNFSPRILAKFSFVNSFVSIPIISNIVPSVFFKYKRGNLYLEVRPRVGPCENTSGRVDPIIKVSPTSVPQGSLTF